MAASLGLDAGDAATFDPDFAQAATLTKSDAHKARAARRAFWDAYAFTSVTIRTHVSQEGGEFGIA